MDGFGALAQLGRDGRLAILHRDPAHVSDLEDVVLAPGGLEPVLASYRSFGPKSYALTAAARAGLAAVSRALPECDCEVQPDAAGRTWLLTRRGARMQAAGWFVLDLPSGKLRPLLHATLRTGARTVAALPEAMLARREPVSWRAADGMTVRGFLTLPPGHAANRVPLVVSVHGGPWNHVDVGYSRVVQLLANRGYAVFEPNFRGSTGFGRGYMLAAQGDFGNGRVQQDIVDGVQYLLRNGVGDPARVAITGASFGGYATLLGVTYRPDLFRAGVAFVPPPDFAWNARWIQRSPAAAELSPVAPIERWMRWVGTDPGNPAWMRRIRAQAPLSNVARVGSPLLLVAGGRDRRVSITGVIEYAARLRSAGKDVELLIDPAAGHRNDEDVAREATTYLLATRLARVLGPASPEVISRKARLYIEENRRLAPRGRPRP
jgi:dipeptidyl aminopeptidase/acylaminoacyl peptidase